MDFEKLIEETLQRQAEGKSCGCPHDEAHLRHVLAAAFAEVRRVTLIAGMKHVCRLCSDGDEPKQGMHNTVVGFVMCVGWPLRALLPPAAEGVGK